MSNKNDITGDSIVNNKGNSKKYSNGWDDIWGKKDTDAIKPEEKQPIAKTKK